MTKTISIDDLGPIAHLDIPVPEGGGVVVLRGRNGNGKSHALRAVTALKTAERQPIRDGHERGIVQGLGARLTVARKTSRVGALEIELLEGEDPTQFVDPGLKDGSAADRRRLEALLRLAGAEASTKLFEELAGGAQGVAAVASPETLRSQDLPDMAARFKRDFEQAARRAEAEAENLRGRREALADAAGEEVQVPDMEGLRRQLHERSVALARLEEQRDAGRQQAARRQEAQEAIAQARAEYEGPAIADAERSLAAKSRVVEEIRQKLAELEKALAGAESEQAAASAALKAAQNHERTVARWEAMVASQVEEVDDGVVEAAQQEVQGVRDDLERGAVLVAQADRQERWKAAALATTEAEKRAEGWRQSAAGVEAVLVAQFAPIAPRGLSLQDGRMVFEHSRGLVHVSELSPGERWSIAIEIATASAGAGGLMVIPQEAWEQLDPENRAAARAAAKRCDVVILTAEAASGELRAEVED